MTVSALGTTFESPVEIREEKKVDRRDYHKLKTLLGLGLVALGAGGLAYLTKNGIESLRKVISDQVLNPVRQTGKDASNTINQLLGKPPTYTNPSTTNSSGGTFSDGINNGGGGSGGGSVGFN